MLALNTQPVEKQVSREDGSLDVVAVWQTIQGEGPFAGTPAVFVRLAGCDLQCPACDTDYTSKRSLYSPRLLATMVMNTRKSGLVVLTGGEPLRQDAGPFICELISYGYQVQLETNGTLYQPRVPYEFTDVVCSPKTPKVHPYLEPFIGSFKYVVQAGQVSEDDGLPLTTLGNTCGVARPPRGFRGQVFIQPLDEQDGQANRANLDVAVQVCLKFNYRLSYQLHKLIGMD